MTRTEAGQSLYEFTEAYDPADRPLELIDAALDYIAYLCDELDDAEEPTP